MQEFRAGYSLSFKLGQRTRKGSKTMWTPLEANSHILEWTAVGSLAAWCLRKLWADWVPALTQILKWWKAR